MLDFINEKIKNYKNFKLENLKSNIELILCSILCCKRIDLYTKNHNLSSNQKELVNQYIDRLTIGEPIQYILKRAPFYGQYFCVNNNVLIPRLDSELIIDIIKSMSPINNLLDVGTGSGNLAITAANENIANNIMATDISSSALKVAKYNHKKICPKKPIDFIRDDFKNCKINSRFNVIISNPPYIPLKKIKTIDAMVKDYEPLNALTDYDDGYTFYQEFALMGHKLLEDNGVMILEIGIDNNLGKLKKIFSKYTIEVFKDFNQIPRAIQLYNTL